MGLKQKFAAGVACLTVLATTPAAHAAAHGHAAAEMVRKLDIMLMVSSLRCRKTSDSFQAEYQNFSARHLHELNAASDELKSDLAQRYGQKGAVRALDRMSVRMANQYGQGHPWLDCHQLKKVTGDLADNREPGALLAAAEKLLDEGGRVNLQASY
jgi:hypothetical protein